MSKSNSERTDSAPRFLGYAKSSKKVPRLIGLRVLLASWASVELTRSIIFFTTRWRLYFYGAFNSFPSGLQTTTNYLDVLLPAMLAVTCVWWSNRVRPLLGVAFASMVVKLLIDLWLMHLTFSHSTSPDMTLMPRFLLMVAGEAILPIGMAVLMLLESGDGRFKSRIL